MLGVLYESYIHPITILSTLPSAGVGAILALMLFHIDLSVIALIGIILLIGIVKKNAIMMIDFALEAEREQGMEPEEAIYQACLLRFRPIMMTTMAALLGGVPLALGTGTGSELRRPLGITIVGGLIVSQILTLFTTPVVYLFFDRIGRKYLHSQSRRRALRTHPRRQAHPPTTPTRGRRLTNNDRSRHKSGWPILSRTSRKGGVSRSARCSSAFSWRSRPARAQDTAFSCNLGKIEEVATPGYPPQLERPHSSRDKSTSSPPSPSAAALPTARSSAAHAQLQLRRPEPTSPAGARNPTPNNASA